MKLFSRAIVMSCFKEKQVPDGTHEQQPDENPLEGVPVKNRRNEGQSVIQQRKCQLLLVSVCILVLLVLFPVTFYILLTENPPEHCTGLPQDSNQICASCSVVGPSYSTARTPVVPTNGGWKRISHNCDICCTEFSEGSHRLLQLFSLQMNMNRTEPNVLKERPAAHMTLNVSALKGSKDQLLWVIKDGLETAFLMGGTRYVNNSIQVPEAGNYFVYSFITFSSAKFDKETILNHYVYRHNARLPDNHIQLLLMNKQTRNGGNLVYQSSLLSAVLRLQADDRVYTTVSEADAIYPSTFSNYMGLFKL